MTRRMPNDKNARKFSAGRDKRTFMDPFLIAAARRRLTWFALPRPTVTASRSVESYAGAKQRAHDFAAQALTNAQFAEQELKRPSSTRNQGTARFAGKPYHWTQTYDGVLRLSPGASPW